MQGLVLWYSENIKLVQLNLLTFFMFFLMIFSFSFSLCYFDPEHQYYYIPHYDSFKSFFTTGIHRDIKNLTVMRCLKPWALTGDFGKAFKDLRREFIPTDNKLLNYQAYIITTVANTVIYFKTLRISRIFTWINKYQMHMYKNYF